VGVEHEAGCARSFAVEHVALDGAAQPCWCGGVEAELVGAACLGLEADAGAVGLAREDAVARAGGAALRVVDDLVGAVVDVESHRERDGALVVQGFAVRAVEQRGVGLVHEAMLKERAERDLMLGRGGDDEQATGFHVEAVDHHGPGAAREGVAHERDGAHLLGRANARHAEHAAGLARDDEARALEQDAERERRIGNAIILWHA